MLGEQRGAVFFQEGPNTSGNDDEDINLFVHTTNNLAAFPSASSRRRAERTPLPTEDTASAFLPEIIPFLAKLYAADKNTSLHISHRDTPEHQESP